MIAFGLYVGTGKDSVLYLCWYFWSIVYVVCVYICMYVCIHIFRVYAQPGYYLDLQKGTTANTVEEKCPGY